MDTIQKGDMASTLVQSGDHTSGFPGANTCMKRTEPNGAFVFVKGATVYHKNPVGPNYVFKNKSGTITGFVNPTRKRAIIKWSTGQVKRHNVTSLTSSAPEKTFLPLKRCEGQVNSSESDSDSDDDEWMNDLLSEI